MEDKKNKNSGAGKGKGKRTDNNYLLKQLIAAGQANEAELNKTPGTINAPDQEETKIEETIEETNILETPITPDPVLELPEKNVGDKDSLYAAILSRKGEKDTIEKTNIPTEFRNKIKILANAEHIAMQDLLANIVAHFFEEYQSQIKRSLKKLHF